MNSSITKRLLKRNLIGFFQLLESRPKRYEGAITTLYHKVGSTEEDYCISAEVFDAQIGYMSRANLRWFTATELANNLARIDSFDNLCVTFDDGDSSAFQATVDLVEAGGKCTHYIIPGRIVQNRKNTMSWEQIRKLEEIGVEIGSHSMTHPHLTRLSDSDLRKELEDSKHLLEDKLGREVSSFAYPYGEHDRRVVNEVRAVGYSCAYTTNHIYVSKNMDLFRIPRFEPTQSLEQLADLYEGKAHLFYKLLEGYIGVRRALRDS